MENFKKVNYPDESSYMEVNQFNKEFTFRVNSYEDLWNLKQLTDVYKHNGLRPLITIPCLIDAQADDRFKDNQSFNLKLVCEFLNSMWCDFRIFHPHNGQFIKAIMDNVEVIDNTFFMREVFKKLASEVRSCHRIFLETSLNIKTLKDNLILMSSDAGGFKPLIKLCDKIGWNGDVVSASKSRSFESGSTVLTQTIGHDDFKGKDVLIVDDLSVYGGTFKGLSKLLKERNCGKLFLAVSHLTVWSLGQDPVTNYFDKVFTTNSKYDNYTCDSNKQPKNLDVLTVF